MRGSLEKSLQRMTLDLHRQIEARRKGDNQIGFREREQQFQLPISGTVGILPAEATTKILFDMVYASDAGVARDSQLGEPIARFGFKMLSAPSGTIPYAHVQDWIYDNDFNFVGANVTVGAHCPAVAYANQQGQIVSVVAFNGILHATFQGYALPIDPAGDGPDGGIPYGTGG